MLRSSKRLRTHEVREILAKGASLRSGDVSGKFLRASGRSRAAVVVSKTTAKGAVVRNRLRRAGYRALKEALPAQGVWAVVFIRSARPTSLALDITNLCSKHT